MTFVFSVQSIASVGPTKGFLMLFSVLRRAIRTFAVPLVVVLGALPAQAQQQITVGTTDNQINGAPFGILPDGSSTGVALYDVGNEFQELYTSDNFQSGFSSPLIINSIGFASSNRIGLPSAATYNVTISLSTTQARVNPTDPNGPNSFKNNFAANKGADFTRVFSGTLTANLQANNTFDLIFPTTPFLYDPSKGNLLFDLVVNQAAVDAKGALFLTTVSNKTFRAYQSGDRSSPTFVDDFGLYTRFSVTPAPVPEASITISFCSFLVLGAGAMAFRRKRRA